MTVEAKKESEKLMNGILPLAKKMLQEYGEFYPYGGYMRWDGTIVDVGAEDPDTEHPKSKDLIYVLRSSFQEMASKKKCKAVAVVFDVCVKIPSSERKSNAIQVCLDHVDGYSAEVFFPYEILSGEVYYGKPFAQHGNREIFPEV